MSSLSRKEFNARANALADDVLRVVRGHIDSLSREDGEVVAIMGVAQALADVHLAMIERGVVVGGQTFQIVRFTHALLLEQMQRMPFQGCVASALLRHRERGPALPWPADLPPYVSPWDPAR